jgi:putative FmdB family regulatory protein
MPIYEFKCPSCGNIKDVLMKSNDQEVQVCGKCGTPMFKIFSAPLSFDFRGTGFYATDYAKK